MSHSIQLQPAYVLHTRAYRDTSLLLELFTRDFGRISALAKGAKANRSKFKGVLQPFSPLLVSWCGKTDLMTLTGAEACGLAHLLAGDGLICGLYLNELLIRLLHRYDAHAELFHVYQETVINLQQKVNQQASLRSFELKLLSELGYAMPLNREAQTGSLIDPEQFYYFHPQEGLFPCPAEKEMPTAFLGKNLLAIHAKEFTQPSYLHDAKRLLRTAINHLLGNKPIKSRELFL